MRHWIRIASLAATLTLLIPTPVLARTTMHGGIRVAGHHHRTVVGNRLVFISRAGFDNRFVFFDRFSERFISVPRHRFVGFGGFDAFGGWDWGGDLGPGRWANYGSQLASAEPPAGEFGALPSRSRPPPSPAELPQCHEETSVGVVIERGGGCAH
jgi:hypothetical protein